MALRRGYGAPGSGGGDRWDCRRRCRPWPILSDLSQVAVAVAARRLAGASPRPIACGKPKTARKLTVGARHRQAV